MPLVRSTAALLLVGAVASAVILPDDNRAVHLDGVVRYPVKPRYGGPVYGKHSKRQIETDTFAKQSGTLYTIDITIGTPGETVPVQFDTGSSELWVNPVCSKSTNPTFCSAQPRYTNSTTIQELDFYGSVVYGTGYVDFQYVVDYVSIGCKYTCSRCLDSSLVLTMTPPQRPRSLSRSLVLPTTVLIRLSASWVLVLSWRDGTAHIPSPSTHSQAKA
jgi:hypothetical protein